MSQSAIAAKLHQSVDIHRHFTPEVTLNAVLILDDVTKGSYLSLGELLNAKSFFDVRLRNDFECERRPDSVDTSQCNMNSLFCEGGQHH